ncbi:MAG: hypothetical protein J5I93_27725 [Pirellulaceae bacterium]|nr:hypothetical protein [Pirellulaceae bacterium]
MKSLLKSVIVLALVAAVAIPVAAQEAVKEKKKKPQAGRAVQAVGAMMKKLEAVDLTAEQKEKIKSIAAEYAPKFKEAQGAVAAIVGPEQRKAMAEARKKAQDEGKKGKELQEAVAAAVKLDGAKAEELQKAQAATRELNAGFTAAIREVLTDEQIAKAGLAVKKAGAKKPGAKKPAKKEAAAGEPKVKLPGNPKSETAEKKADN